MAINYWEQAEEKYTAGDRSWLSVPEDFWWEMLEVLPPIYCGPWFAVSEAWKHLPTGEPLLLFFQEKPEHACRIATRAEIKAELDLRKAQVTR